MNLLDVALREIEPVRSPKISLKLKEFPPKKKKKIKVRVKKTNLVAQNQFRIERFSSK